MLTYFVKTEFTRDVNIVRLSYGNCFIAFVKMFKDSLIDYWSGFIADFVSFCIIIKVYIFNS